MSKYMYEKPRHLFILKLFIKNVLGLGSNSIGSLIKRKQWE